MSSAENTRPVWLTETQASRCPVDVMRAWDAAPDDAVEALSLWLRKNVDADLLRSRLVAQHSLWDALGMPGAPDA